MLGFLFILLFIFSRVWDVCWSCIKPIGLDGEKGSTNTCCYGLDESKWFLRSGIRGCCLAHKLDGLPGGKVVRVPGLL